MAIFRFRIVCYFTQSRLMIQIYNSTFIIIAVTAQLGVSCAGWPHRRPGFESQVGAELFYYSLRALPVLFCPVEAGRGTLEIDAIVAKLTLDNRRAGVLI